MQVDNCTLVHITKDYMSRNVEKFLAIEYNWTSIGESPWGKKNYLLELHRKWDLSFAIEHKKRIVAYIIGSQENNLRAKVNKIVVDTGCRRKGFGKRLISKFESECLHSGINEVELKALVDNKSANNFYIKMGYQLTGYIEGTDRKIRNTYIKRLI
jgi:ribosomal protein S18 acetylase RimI-like enzyme